MFHVPFEAWHFLEDWLGCQIQFYSVLSVLSSIYLSFEMDVCDILVLRWSYCMQAMKNFHILSDILCK